MKLNQEPRLPLDIGQLTRRLTDIIRDICSQVNGLTDGRISAHTTATAAPTTGTYAQGDKLWNSSPSELGTAGSKYVVIGWVCTASGTPGTWLQMRTLTGN